MLLSQLADHITEAIRTAPPETWGGTLKIPSDVPVHFALDPFTDSGELIKGPAVFVIPSYVQYSVGTRRNSQQPASKLKYVTVALCIRIKTASDAPVYDVTSKQLAKDYVDLKEYLDDFLVGLAIPNCRLTEIETEPPDELELKDNYYIVTSVLAYAAC